MTIAVAAVLRNRGDADVYVAAGATSGLCGHHHAKGEMARKCVDAHAESERRAGRVSDRAAYVLRPNAAVIRTRTDRCRPLTHMWGAMNGWRHD